MRGRVLLPFSLVAVACAPSPTGTFSGELVESRNLSLTTQHEGDTATIRRLGGGATEQGVAVTITGAGDDRYALTLHGCALELSADGHGRLEIEGITACSLTFDGWTGDFSVQGSGRVTDERLTLDLIGSASEPGASGGFAWTYRGARAR